MPLVHVFVQIFYRREIAADLHVDVSIILQKEICVIRNHILVTDQIVLPLSPEAVSSPINRKSVRQTSWIGEWLRKEMSTKYKIVINCECRLYLTALVDLSHRIPLHLIPPQAL